jgi:hypothetical protein
MLHTETVEIGTLQLLKKLESESRLSSFCLAGGTALALYIGHRLSFDTVLLPGNVGFLLAQVPAVQCHNPSQGHHLL